MFNATVVASFARAEHVRHALENLDELFVNGQAITIKYKDMRCDKHEDSARIDTLCKEMRRLFSSNTIILKRLGGIEEEVHVFHEKYVVDIVGAIFLFAYFLMNRELRPRNWPTSKLVLLPKSFGHFLGSWG